MTIRMQLGQNCNRGVIVSCNFTMKCILYMLKLMLVNP